MNLKDRMNSGSQDLKPMENVKPQNMQNTMQKSNQPSQEQTLLSKVQELTEALKTEKQKNSDLQEEITSDKKQMREQTALIHRLSSEKSDLQSTSQTLLSKNQEMQSQIADLKAELSSVQKINLSLTTNNQSLVKQNDDLRNNAGLLSRKEQEQLEEKYRNLTTGADKLKKQVNMSNVEAVESAQAAQKAAERKAEKDIADYKESADKKVSEAVSAKNTAIRQTKEKVKAAKKNQQIAWGSLLVTLLCCLIAYPTFSWDIWYFISVPAGWAWDRLNNYAGWVEKPYYTRSVMGVEQQVAFSTGWAWFLRILTFILIIACIGAVIYGTYRIALYYKKRWCNLSLKVLLISIAVIIVFGEGIRTHININLVLLLLIVQLLYLGVLAYLDGYYETRNRTDEWEKLQRA